MRHCVTIKYSNEDTAVALKKQLRGCKVKMCHYKVAMRLHSDTVSHYKVALRHCVTIK